jgi:DNA-binding NarL/FixJ family response regulator
VLVDMALPGCLGLPTMLDRRPPIKFVAFAVPDLDDVFQRLASLPKSQARPSLGGLTDRELEILSLVDRGHSNKQISQRLGISTATVKNHVHDILQKLQVHGRGAAAAAIRCVGEWPP